MSLRRRVAERYATPLKRAGSQTPILDQIPHKAEEITAFYYQAIESSPAGRSGQILRAIQLPAIAHGKAYGETAGFWYKVTFPKPILNVNVVAMAEGRKGAIPDIKAPRITLPSFKLTVPSLELPITPSITIPAYDIPVTFWSLGHFTGPWPDLVNALNNMRDTVQAGLDTVSSMNMKLANAFEKTKQTIQNVNNSIKDFRDKEQAALNQYKTNIENSFNNALEQYRTNFEDSLNKGLASILPTLYSMWGIANNMILTPIYARNVTSTGFEFQSFGKCTIHWLAIGTRA